MNKVDAEVKNLMLLFPEQFPNRFKALESIFSNSGYGWDKNGCLVGRDRAKGTKESMIRYYADILAKRNKEIADTKCPELIPLHTQWLCEAQGALLRAEFIAKNIDIYASRFCDCDYEVSWLWLYHHQNENFNYWHISHKPEVVDEEWREAIYGWAHHLVPTMNGLMGVPPQGDRGWTPQSQYKGIFNYIYGLMRSYASPKDIEVALAMSEMITKILKESER